MIMSKPSPQFIPRIYKNTERLLTKLPGLSEEYWKRRGRTVALKQFHLMAEYVPAYKDFLKKNGVKKELIKTFTDFQQLPTIDKDNYLRSYDLKDLCWNGNLDQRQLTISSTSGSTGEPFFFPREDTQDQQYAILAELYLRTNFQIDKKSTLYIVGFPMGQWIGGVFTYEALKIVAERGRYPLSVITPGINSQEIIKIVKKLGPQFDQIIIGSYGPFLKDTLDEGDQQKLNWKEYNVGFIFSAEVFSEVFRDYVAKKVGLKNIFTHTLNHYGTVDLGTMAYETPISILARRKAVKDKKIFQSLFGNIFRLPTLTQYFPDQFFFEDVGGSLLCSAFSGLPLVRYDLKDRGGVISFSELKAKFAEHGTDLDTEAKVAGVDKTIWQLPFVYVYERSDLSISFYAFQIYPETIRKVVQSPRFQNYLTGRFTMMVTDDEKSNPKLEIHLELKEGRKEDKAKKNKIGEATFKQLILENSEYRKTLEMMGKRRVYPHIIFWPHRHPKYFNPLIKQKWIQK